MCVHGFTLTVCVTQTLKPLILPVGAQLSVNKGRESKERKRRSGLIFALLHNPEEISESFTKHNSFKMYYSPQTNGLKHNSCSQLCTLESLEENPQDCCVVTVCYPIKISQFLFLGCVQTMLFFFSVSSTVEMDYMQLK